MKDQWKNEKQEIKKEWNRNNLKDWKINQRKFEGVGGYNGSHFSTTFFVYCRTESENEHHVV